MRLDALPAVGAGTRGETLADVDITRIMEGMRFIAETTPEASHFHSNRRHLRQSISSYYSILISMLIIVLSPL